MRNSRANTSAHPRFLAGARLQHVKLLQSIGADLGMDRGRGGSESEMNREEEGSRKRREGRRKEDSGCQREEGNYRGGIKKHGERNWSRN